MFIKLKFLLLGLLSISLTASVLSAAAADYYLIEGEADTGYYRVALQVQPGLVAGLNSVARSELTEPMSKIKGIHSNYQDFTIYELYAADLDSTQNFLEAHPAAFAPVFLNSGGGFEIAMGGVIIYFSPNLAATEIERLLASYNILEATAPEWVGGGYQVATAPGLAALELANTLQVLPEVNRAIPNFWSNSYSHQ